MNVFDAQLLLGLIAILAWGCTGALIIGGHDIRSWAVGAFAVAFMSALVVNVFGSLFLRGTLSIDSWVVVGTGGRGAIAIAGVVALLDTYGPRR